MLAGPGASLGHIPSRCGRAVSGMKKTKMSHPFHAKSRFSLIFLSCHEAPLNHYCTGTLREIQRAPAPWKLSCHFRWSPSRPLFLPLSQQIYKEHSNLREGARKIFISSLLTFSPQLAWALMHVIDSLPSKCNFRNVKLILSSGRVRKASVSFRIRNIPT